MTRSNDLPAQSSATLATRRVSRPRGPSCYPVRTLGPPATMSYNAGRITTADGMRIDPRKQETSECDPRMSVPNCVVSRSYR